MKDIFASHSFNKFCLFHKAIETARNPIKKTLMENLSSYTLLLHLMTCAQKKITMDAHDFQNSTICFYFLS